MKRRKRYLLTYQSNLSDSKDSVILFVTPLEMRDIIKDYIECQYSIVHISNI
jgi:hypothetical protein